MTSSNNPECSFDLSVQYIKEFSKVSGAANKQIRIISEGSCDTEDWSNDTENSALPSHE